MIKKIIGLIRSLYDWTLLWAKHPQSGKALAILSFLEASIFPIPVDPLLLAMGFANNKKSLYYAFITTFFSVLGAIGGYVIGVYAWELVSPFFFKFVFPQSAFDTTAADLHDATFISIFIAGFSPIPFKIFTVAAGVVKAPFTTFVVASIVARGLRYFILGGLIYFKGPQAQAWIENNFEKMTYIVCVVLILSLALAHYLI